MLRRIPRQPRTHLTNEQIVLRVATLEHLSEHLRLLDSREAATHLHASHVRLELDLVIIHLLELLLVLQLEHSELLLDIRLLHVGIVNSRELLGILEEVVDLQGILRRKERHELLHALDLPLVVYPLDKALEHELLLLLDHLLRTEEGDDTILLCRDLRVLIKIINVRAVVLSLRESLALAGHFLYKSSPVKVTNVRPSDNCAPVCSADSRRSAVSAVVEPRRYYDGARPCPGVLGGPSLPDSLHPLVDGVGCRDWCDRI